MASVERILQAITSLSAVEGVEFDPKSLAEDVVGVAAALPEEGEFEAAIAATVRMLGLIVAERVDVSALSEDYEGWECCHFQPHTGCGEKATMRIMLTRTEGAVRVRGFGDRRLPDDFYRRMAAVGRPDLQGHD